MAADQPWVCPWGICNHEQAQECRALPTSKDGCGRRFPPGTTLEQAKRMIGPAPLDVEREAFIAHFRPLQPLWQFQDDGTGGFHNQCTEWAWIGWRAARTAGVLVDAAALPFDAEYVHGYLSEVLKETVGNTKDPHVRAFMAWLMQQPAVGVSVPRHQASPLQGTDEGEKK